MTEKNPIETKIKKTQKRINEDTGLIKKKKKSNRLVIATSVLLLIVVIIQVVRAIISFLNS